MLELNPEALDIARKLDAERAAGRRAGPLHGIPILLKDNIASGDRLHTTAGAAALQDWVADRDAFLVQQIRAAGGLILSKANLSEWANFMDFVMFSGFSTVGGQTWQPLWPLRSVWLQQWLGGLSGGQPDYGQCRFRNLRLAHLARPD
ncbi:MAG: amidase family protein [Anaerolineae bacterium]